MNRRLRLLTAGILIVWGVIAVRLAQLQWRWHDVLSRHAFTQQAMVEVIPARLGDIVDRHGRLLATSCRFDSLFVNPSHIDRPALIAERLAEALELDADQLKQRIAQHRERAFIWVKRRLSSAEVDAVRKLDLPAESWGLRQESGRAYPQRLLAAHILGWRNIDGIAQAGVERTLDSSLQGTDGRRTLVRDARGFVIEILDHVTRPPAHGETVTLTLDLTIQRAAEERMDALVEQWRPRSAAAIVLDPQSGEVLAMTSRPSFDPASPSDAPADAWINHAVASAFEPGSTIKPCIAGWAVDREVISTDETFACNGIYRMGPRVMHDHRAFGSLDVSAIIAHSSNIGMAQIGERLGNQRLFSALQDFGFGRRTGVELPGESAGIVRPLSEWDHYSTGSIPIGQELAVTALQMAAAHAALANGGRLVTPHLVLETSSDEHSPIDVLATRILAPETARWMTTGPLVAVVRDGTARRAAIDGVTVFAKTGTAQVYDPETGTYAKNRYVSSCICGAPAESPQLLVLVVVNSPTAESNPSGGTVAAPAASDILEQALRYLQSSRPSESRF